MNWVFDNNNKTFADIRNQEVYAVEGGYNIHHREFAVNVNAYYTIWKNKPPASSPVPIPTTDGPLYYNINGLNALHRGLEVDFVYKGIKNLEVEGLASFGDWITTSGSKANITNEDGQIVGEIDFSAKGVHVGDAAQMQLAGSLRYEIIKQLYVKARYTYFDKNFANFDPTLLVNDNRDRESWQMPAYGLLDFFAGYDFRYWKSQFTFTAGINNVLNTIYLTDALNGTQFNAATASVYMGMGRRITGSLRITF
jgi:outer membrane receptor protein involved in Fe transport